MDTGVLKFISAVALMLITVLIGVPIYNHLKQKELRKAQLLANGPSTENNNYGYGVTSLNETNSQSTNENQQITNNETTVPRSDREVIFAPSNEQPLPVIDISRLNITLATTIIEDIDERRRQIEMQNEFERRAEERRQLVERHLAILNVPPSFDSINSSGSTTQLNDLRIVAERSTSRRNPPTPSLTTEAHNFYFNRYWHTQDLDTDDGLPTYEEALAANTTLSRF